MKNPMVSIVIPVYNGANYMREAIDSALAQTYENFEILVVNDGSNDNGATERIARSYGDKIRYFAKENGGIATALNLAIRNMKGEYFSWLSHDDLYHPEKLAAQIDALQKNENMRAIAYCDFDYLDMTSGEKTPVSLSQHYTIKQITTSVFPLFFGVIYGCTLLIHRSHFDRVGLFDKSLVAVQDEDMWFRLFRNEKLVYVPGSYVCLRVHPNQYGVRVRSKFKRESAEYYLNAAKSLSGKEIEEAFGSRYTFYHRVAGKIYSKGEPDIYAAFVEMFCLTEAFEEEQGQVGEFLEWFDQLRGGCSKLCIFGTGQLGKQLHYALASRGIGVDFFSTNTPGRWGTDIEGCRCISPSELSEMRDDTLVMIALRVTNTVKTQLEDMGCSNIVSKEVLDSRLLDVAPNKIPEYTLMYN